MATYKLTVDIDSNQYPKLKASGLRLCIAKKVNGVYDVVWSGADFSQNNVFEWVEEYQVFALMKYQSGIIIVEQISPPQNIQFGQTCVMEPDFTLDPATGPVDHSGIFHFVNDNGPIYAGVNCKLNSKFLPIFVSTTVVSGTLDIEPLPVIMAWFALKVETGMMIHGPISNSIEVSYQGTTSHTISYQGATVGVWVLEDANGMGMVQPRRGYSRDTGIFYEDSSADPYTFLEEARSYRNPLAIESAASQADLECTVEFPSSSDADDARAYLKQKIIPNICQVVPDKVDDLTFIAKLKLSSITFMKEMMKGETDEGKIENAFNSELDGLAIPTTARTFTHSASSAVENPCVLLSLGTKIALDRDTKSKTAVIGSDIVKVAPREEWKFIPVSPIEHGHFYITGVRPHPHATYLSVHGHPASGSAVIHSSTKTVWAVSSGGGGIRISIPGTSLSVVLGQKHDDYYEIILKELLLVDNYIWKVVAIL